MFTASFLQVLGLLQVLHAAVSSSLLNFSAPRALFRAWSPQSASRCRFVKEVAQACAQSRKKQRTPWHHLVFSRRGAAAAAAASAAWARAWPGNKICVVRSISQPFSVACPFYMHNQWLSRKEMILPLLRTVIVDDFCEDLCLSPLLDKHVVAQGGSPCC